MNSILFPLVLSFSLILVMVFFWGRNTNLRRTRVVAGVLEKVLRPEDKIYTWIGGYVGFYGEYRVSGYGKVEAVFTMLPRQSLLYFPLLWISGRRDKLEILFRLKRNNLPEFHIIRKGSFGSQLPRGKEYHKEDILIGKRRYRFYFQGNFSKFKAIEPPFLKRLLRMSNTEETGVFFLSLSVQDPLFLERDLTWALEFIRREW